MVERKLYRADGRSELIQMEAIAALTAAAASEGSCKRIDTHMSHLFVGRSFVYKLIRAIDHVYADLSSIEARRFACFAEIEANSILGPDLYVDVRPVVRDAAGIVGIERVGEIIDWTVVMRRFPDGALFGEMASAGTLTRKMVEEAAEVVATFHVTLVPRRDLGGVNFYTEVIQSVERTAAEVANSDLVAISKPLFLALRAILMRQAPLIEERRLDGFVRRGHGDLHLANICLYGGRVTPFDALAFDPALATTDILFDVAFLLMDLRAKGLHAFANAAMNTYLDAAQQPESGLALLPLLMSLRTAIRMAVAAERGNLVEAGAYGRLGLALLVPTTPKLVAIGGLSGSGKTVVARLIAPALDGPCGARLLVADRIRKSATAGRERAEPLYPDAYRPEARAAVYRKLDSKAAAALDAASSVVADATFRDQETRTKIEAAAGTRPFLGIWLDADAETRAKRVTGRSGDLSDATAAVASAQVGPSGLGPAWRVVSALGSVEHVNADALQCLAVFRPACVDAPLASRLIHRPVHERLASVAQGSDVA